MDYKSALFSFDGRFNRMQYFGWTIATVVAATVLALILVAIGSANDATAVLAIILGCIATVGYVYVGMAVMAKRLHDLGYATINLLWIWLINLASAAFHGTSETLSLLLSIVGFGIGMYLLFAPGQTGTN